MGVTRLVAISVLALALPACSSDDDAAPSGEATFSTRCASCHGQDAQGIVGPPLVGVADRSTRDEMISVVHDGRGRMPRWGDTLSDDEIAAVVDYVRTL